MCCFTFPADKSFDLALLLLGFTYFKLVICTCIFQIKPCSFLPSWLRGFLMTQVGQPFLPLITSWAPLFHILHLKMQNLLSVFFVTLVSSAHRRD